jgi:hypothetical protein
VDTEGPAYKWLQKMGEGELAGMLKLGTLKYNLQGDLKGRDS